MKLLNAVLLLLFSTLAVAEPTITKGQAVGIISQEMRETLLMWSPFPIPYEIDQGRKDKDALLLEALLRHNLLKRDGSIRMIESLDDGKVRRKAVSLWRYDYAEARDTDALEGFYYGYGRLIRLLSLSEPIRLDDDYFVEAKVEWAVSDLPEWVKDPAFSSARTLRRSVESAQKPFEKTVYLKYVENHWAVWHSPNEPQ